MGHVIDRERRLRDDDVRADGAAVVYSRTSGARRSAVRSELGRCLAGSDRAARGQNRALRRGKVHAHLGHKVDR